MFEGLRIRIVHCVFRRLEDWLGGGDEKVSATVVGADTLTRDRCWRVYKEGRVWDRKLCNPCEGAGALGT